MPLATRSSLTRTISGIYRQIFDSQDERKAGNLLMISSAQMRSSSGVMVDFADSTGIWLTVSTLATKDATRSAPIAFFHTFLAPVRVCLFSSSSFSDAFQEFLRLRFQKMWRDCVNVSFCSRTSISASSPVTASIRRMPAAMLLSLAMRKRPICAQ